ncbi:GDSL-type esterase/lipase family protein [Eudoraea sp.]|uniref:GDSL-type esterase/lipase family protein n=1 Tax=Eudoraea sp. TaxID=1979955 RepID=UPI003C75D763
MPRTTLLILLFISLSYQTSAQSVGLFDDEVLQIQKKYDSLWDSKKKTIVFTGSSSIRMWPNLQESFPNHQIVNSGFGGSEATDLSYYLKELVLAYKPFKVFIYEGDNDINLGKSPKEIISVTKDIISKILAENATTEIVLISAKPSIARWKLKGKYRRLNNKLAKLSNKSNGVLYANVWDSMVENKKLKKELFLEDDLHMNSLGYDLWFNVIKNYIN